MAHFAGPTPIGVPPKIMDPNTVDPTKLFGVKGMVVVITGGGTGIGLMMTKAFANNGAAKAYIVGRRKEKLEEAAREASPHGNVIPIVGDATSKDSLRRVAEQIKNETGYVNLVCANSGWYSPPISAEPNEATLEEYADACMEQNMEDWNTGFATNTTAVAFTTFAFLKLLDAGNKAQNFAGIKSQVLVTTSIAGYLRNPLGFSAYPMTKAATTHLVKSLSGALVPYSIRVNGIAPGLFPGDLSAGITRSKGDPCVEGAFEKGFIPAERLGATSDMAGTVLYMASPAGAYLNGCVNVVDGGRIGQIAGTY
ncbi:Short-chain dehydrogenase/reductase SAT3 [Fulvia fulva]|nr:Short-chain dehydrogenase/reductase SAT3 [Fulvia fulva]WPV15963.1 Short-chain dehydrogenase/reductase SAT3 [Fulvia fulva]WPV31376.1 Short-chain dehydrogenase/reductase SAT3 [Fulvia fulva]